MARLLAHAEDHTMNLSQIASVIRHRLAEQGYIPEWPAVLAIAAAEVLAGQHEADAHTRRLARVVQSQEDTKGDATP